MASDRGRAGVAGRRDPPTDHRAPGVRAGCAAGTPGRGPGDPRGRRVRVPHREAPSSSRTGRVMRATRYRAKFLDPAGDRYGIPTYPWRSAPAGYATIRQLRAEGLRPGGQEVRAQVLWRGIGGTRA